MSLPYAILTPSTAYQKLFQLQGPFAKFVD